MRKNNLYIILIFAVLIAIFAANYFIPITHYDEKNAVSQVSRQFLNNITLPSPKTSIVHKQFNFHIIVPGVWRSSQPNKESILRMKQHGLKTIINLRRNQSVHVWEGNLAGNLGMQYYHFPMDAKEKQDEDKLKRILSIMNDPTNQPVLIHCYAGKDRTGLMSALYKLQFTAANVNDVHQEMLMYGYSENRFLNIIETVKSWRKDKVG